MRDLATVGLRACESAVRLLSRRVHWFTMRKSEREAARMAEANRQVVPEPDPNAERPFLRCTPIFPSPSTDWLDRVIGSMKNEPAFNECPYPARRFASARGLRPADQAS